MKVKYLLKSPGQTSVWSEESWRFPDRITAFISFFKNIHSDLCVYFLPHVSVFRISTLSLVKKKRSFWGHLIWSKPANWNNLLWNHKNKIKIVHFKRFLLRRKRWQRLSKLKLKFQPQTFNRNFFLLRWCFLFLDMKEESEIFQSFWCGTWRTFTEGLLSAAE